MFQRWESATASPGDRRPLQIALAATTVRRGGEAEGGEAEGGRCSSGDTGASSALTGCWWDGEWADVEIISSFDYSSVWCIYRAAIKPIKSTDLHRS